jgi:hypothetical protein
MRIKLISGGKEVDKRYLGSRLVWRNDGVLHETPGDIQVSKINGFYTIYVGSFRRNPEDIVAFKLGDKNIFRLKVEKFSRGRIRSKLQISQNEPGITEYLEMENKYSNLFTNLKLYEFLED